MTRWTAADIEEGQRYPLRDGGECIVVDVTTHEAFPGWTFVAFRKIGDPKREHRTMAMFLELLKHS